MIKRRVGDLVVRVWKSIRGELFISIDDPELEEAVEFKADLWEELKRVIDEALKKLGGAGK